MQDSQQYLEYDSFCVKKKKKTGHITTHTHIHTDRHTHNYFAERHIGRISHN